MIQDYYEVIEYDRHIFGHDESFRLSDGLVQISLESKNKGSWGIWLGYNSKGELPFEVSLNPDDGTIREVNFFLEIERVKFGKVDSEISFEPYSISVDYHSFALNSHHYVRLEKDFDYILSENSITVIEKNSSPSLIGYELNKSNYILVNEKDEIAGVILKDLNLQELNKLKESKFDLPPKE